MNNTWLEDYWQDVPPASKQALLWAKQHPEIKDDIEPLRAHWSGKALIWWCAIWGSLFLWCLFILFFRGVV